MFPAEAQIKALFDRWNAPLASGNANRVANPYAPDSVLLLLPTDSSEIRITRAARVDAVDSGLYEFTLTNKDGSKSKVDVRYTFVYERSRGKWLIVTPWASLARAHRAGSRSAAAGRTCAGRQASGPVNSNSPAGEGN